MARTKKRKHYTDEQRNTIMATAERDGLDAAAVQKKFGVAQVTYYSWRKKAKATTTRGTRTTTTTRTRGTTTNGTPRVQIVNGEIVARIPVTPAIEERLMQFTLTLLTPAP